MSYGWLFETQDEEVSEILLLIWSTFLLSLN